MPMPAPTLVLPLRRHSALEQCWRCNSQACHPVRRPPPVLRQNLCTSPTETLKLRGISLTVTQQQGSRQTYTLSLLRRQAARLEGFAVG